MKKTTYTLIIAILFISFFNICCNEDSPVTQKQPTSTPPCETYNTAKVFFQNKSTSGKTYDVIWDGSRIFTIGPGQQSDTITAAAQIQHTLHFIVSGTNTSACTESYPILVKCSIHWYWCDN